MAKNTNCTNCRNGTLVPFYEHTNVPTNSCILLATADEAASCQRGDIVLAACEICGFISNIAFDTAKTEYSSRYEETQGFSPTFRQYHEKLARTLVERYGLQGKRVVEIGCGKGDFLSLVCGLGSNQGIGFDPGFDATRKVAKDLDVTFVQDFFSEKYAGEKADLLCCKMTLEHIHRPHEFIKMTRDVIDWNSDTVLFYQVPEAMRILRDCALEDVYYEHCSYFTDVSLRHLFECLGFEVLRTATEYADQYLTVEAKIGTDRPVNPDPLEIERIRNLTATFHDRAAETRQRWIEMLRPQGTGETVIWGSGSKAVSVLSHVNNDVDISHIVDINPHRQNTFIAGGGQKIIGPEQLNEIRPANIVVMNKIYIDEVQNTLDAQSLSANVVAI